MSPAEAENTTFDASDAEADRAQLRWPGDQELLGVLGPWMHQRRWYPLKDGAVPTPDSLTLVADVPLAPGVRDLLIAVKRDNALAASGQDPDALAGGSILVHVPVVLERGDVRARFAVPGEDCDSAGVYVASTSDARCASGALSGAGQAGFDDGVTVVDGAHHPAFWRAWASAASQAGSVLDSADAAAIVERADQAQVMTGEQSNTNVVMRTPAGSDTPDLVVKLFRVLSPGPNPDVDVSCALAAQGWDRVRRPVAWSVMSWVDPDSGQKISTHAAVATTFIPQAHDGFELFCALAASDVADSQDAQCGDARLRAVRLARDLGATTAQMHRMLARACGEDEPDSVEGFVAGLHQRALWALEEVPDLRRQIPELADRIGRVYSRLGRGALEPATRIHGDYHLGQVLREKIAGLSAGDEADCGRWFVLDFEGEPLRPLSERLLPDQPFRDVAGMLRSFDYAAAVGGGDSQAAAEWLGAVRAAFVEGYESTCAASGDDASLGVGQRRRALLDALELDKALYEAVYEARNRPDWLHIPVRGVQALLQ